MMGWLKEQKAGPRAKSLPSHQPHNECNWKKRRLGVWVFSCIHSSKYILIFNLVAWKSWADDWNEMTFWLWALLHGGFLLPSRHFYMCYSLKSKAVTFKVAETFQGEVVVSLLFTEDVGFSPYISLEQPTKGGELEESEESILICIWISP